MVSIERQISEDTPRPIRCVVKFIDENKTKKEVTFSGLFSVDLIIF